MVSSPTRIEPAPRGVLRRLGLRTQLRLGLGTGIALIVLPSALIVLASWQIASGLRHIQNTHLPLTDATLHAKEDMTEARRYEKDFLLAWRELGYDEARARYLSLVCSMVDEVVAHMAEIRRLAMEAHTQQVLEGTAEIDRQVRLYEASFHELVELHGRIGYMNTGLEGRFRERASEIERIIPPAATPLMIELLALRRGEKDYLLRGKMWDIEAVRQAERRFRQRLSRTPGISAEKRAALAALIDDYAALFDEHVEVRHKIDATRQQLSAVANVIEPLLETLHQRTNAASDVEFNKAVRTTTQATTAFVIGGATAIVLMLLVTWAVWRGILRSAARTEEFSARIAAGDLTMRLETGDETDELDRIDHALNRMADALLASRQSLEERAYQLEQASRGKDEFLAAISHELKTPLNHILGFSDLLKEGLTGELSAEQKGMAQDIFDAGSRQLAIINSLIELARLQAGKAKLQARPEDPAKMLGEIATRHAAKAQAAGLAFAVEVAEGLGEMPLDREVVTHLLDQLLANAFKFTPAGGKVSLVARRVPRTDVAAPVRIDADEYLELAVADNGPGIAPEILPRLFQPFVQGDGRLARRHGGTGIGLVLVRLLAELHGGGSGVESAPGNGAKFLVWLPCGGAEVGAASRPR